MSTQIAPSPTFAVVLWVSMATVGGAAVATIAFGVGGAAIAAATVLAMAYAALTIAGRRWSR